MTDPDSCPNSAPDRICNGTTCDSVFAPTGSAFLHFFVFSPGDEASPCEK